MESLHQIYLLFGADLLRTIHFQYSNVKEGYIEELKCIDVMHLSFRKMFFFFSGKTGNTSHKRVKGEGHREKLANR